MIFLAFLVKGVWLLNKSQNYDVHYKLLTQDCLWSHIVKHTKIKSFLKLFMTYSCSGSMYMKEIKIKQTSVNFKVCPFKNLYLEKTQTTLY